MGGYQRCDLELSPAIRRRLNGCGLTLAVLLAAPACWADMYRWVDEHGAVHYSDSIPPRYSGVGHEELDSQGRVVKNVAGAPRTAAERKRHEEEEAQEAAQATAAREQQRRDAALAATYDSTAEIDRARDRALAQEQAQIDGLQVLGKQSQSASESARIDAMIRQHQQAMDGIRLRFEADKARYRQLTGKP